MFFCDNKGKELAAYEILQSDFSNKIKKEKAKPPGYDRLTNREMDAYEKAVLACKSILKQYFTFNNDNGAKSVIVEVEPPLQLGIAIRYFRLFNN